VSAASLFFRFTLKPPLPAAAVSVTLQLSFPDPVMDTLLQQSVLNEDPDNQAAFRDLLIKRHSSRTLPMLAAER
jgi:hypothetical protein